MSLFFRGIQLVLFPLFGLTASVVFFACIVQPKNMYWPFWGLMYVLITLVGVAGAYIERRRNRVPQ
jgi:hypothetical protein